MKKLLLALNQESRKKKGLYRTFEKMAIEIAKFNGGCYPHFLPDMFIDILIQEINAEFGYKKILFPLSKDETTYTIGFRPSKGYVELGTITRINIL